MRTRREKKSIIYHKYCAYAKKITKLYLPKDANECAVLNTIIQTFTARCGDGDDDGEAFSYISDMRRSFSTQFIHTHTTTKIQKPKIYATLRISTSKHTTLTQTRINNLYMYFVCVCVCCEKLQSFTSENTSLHTKFNTEPPHTNTLHSLLYILIIIQQHATHTHTQRRQD